MITDNIILQILVYFSCIALIHYLYTFFRDTLTTPKIKDLVDTPKMDYKKFYSSFSNNEHSNTGVNGKNKNEDNTDDMKQELKSFFKSLNTDNVEPSNQINSTQPINDNSVQSFKHSEELQYSSF